MSLVASERSQPNYEIFIGIMVLNVHSALARRSADAVPCPYVGRAPPTPARRSWAAALMSSICRLPRPDGPAIILTSVGHFHFILHSQNVNSGLWLPPRISFPQEVILGVWEGIFLSFFFFPNADFISRGWCNASQQWALNSKNIFTVTNLGNYFIKMWERTTVKGPTFTDPSHCCVWISLFTSSYRGGNVYKQR